MVGTRSARSRPAADEPLVELPATMRKPSAGKKRRGKMIDQPTVEGNLNKGDNIGIDTQMAGVLDKMEVDPEAVNVEATNPVDEPYEPVDVRTPALSVDSAMHDAANRDGSTVQEASLTTPAASKSSEPKISLSPRGPPNDPPLQIRTPGKRPLAPLGYHDGEGAATGYSEMEVRRTSRGHFPKPGEEPYSETPPEETILEKSMSKTSPRNISGQAMPQTDGVNDNVIDSDSDWEEEYLMSNPKSIYGSNLQDFFNPVSWDKLSDTDKAHLMKYLPECDKVYQSTLDVTDPTPPKAELVDDFWENPQLVTRISQVEYDIAEGKYTAANQKAVNEARRRAQDGEFDGLKENKFEAFWGQKQRVEYNVVAGDTSSVRLQTLAEHSALRVGDVFSLRRSFSSRGKGGGGGITVEKDAKLTAIDPDDFSLTFSYPPGRLQVSSDDKPDKIITGVVSITALETLLCKEDGRPPSKLPNGNAFKTIRIKRNEQDIGSLFDVRMEFYAKYLSPKA